MSFLYSVSRKVAGFFNFVAFKFLRLPHVEFTTTCEVCHKEVQYVGAMHPDSPRYLFKCHPQEGGCGQHAIMLHFNEMQHKKMWAAIESSTLNCDVAFPGK